ncbi:SpvB/TcaC N-terminal domain-containing protein [Vibrio natriegens]|uniref:SpvB/TcaC N-terminal domain-containing protein n=1 Tax=Vibrio natriegens TaxID=691 RepID=UPI0022835EDD|nr:SpvB/TcaC N-terminal domain-containing protein [Vibrio natriegens]MCY9877328.1 SpvB/TcaC N-terminal domain-containing protein [Vibrio natriegens]
MKGSIRRVSPIVVYTVITSMLFSNSALAIQNLALLAASTEKSLAYPHYFDSSSLQQRDTDLAIKHEFAEQEKLFDTSTVTGFDKPTTLLVERYFESVTSIPVIQVYGSAEYKLYVEQKINNLWTNIPDLTGLNLSDLPDEKWNTLLVNGGIKTGAVRVQLIALNDHPKALSELRFLDKNSSSIVSHLLNPPLEMALSEKVAVSDNKKALLGAAPGKFRDAKHDNQFNISLPYHPDQLKSATLNYEVKGLSGSASTIRMINDSFSQGGLIIHASQTGLETVSEPIDTDWLKAGNNLIRFSPFESSDSHLNYHVENVRLSFELKEADLEHPFLYVFEPQSNLRYQGHAYVRGFVQGDGVEFATFKVGDKTVQTVDGSFETLIPANVPTIMVEAKLQSGETLKETLTFAPREQVSETGVMITAAGVKALQNSQALTERHVARDSAKVQHDTMIALKEAELNVFKNSISSDRDIEIFTLAERDIPALDQGMVNVTRGDAAAYRFLPHGIKFDQSNTLTLGYEKSKIPEGYSDKDVFTYFYDDETNRWVQLERNEVVSEAGVIVSKTEHFTDMINAVIQTPDSPETQAFGTTQLKDLKAANPGASINLIQAPKANALGDARVSYPIELPGGRQGMEPQLHVSYSSVGGNGWMGIGWNLSLPTVSIDTRWGVPRYLNEAETETYLFAGEQLTPVAHRSSPVSRTSEKRFYPRVEGSFNRIIRHGSNPTNYWWEVTNKNGTRNFFGGDGNGLAPNATLVTEEGNISDWALVKTIDTYGNTVNYNYQKVYDSGVGDGIGGVQGQQLYIQSINYTGFNGSDGAYTVEFKRDRDIVGEERRPDITIDARTGFKRVTADLLREIRILFQGQLVRSYEFKYTQGAFYKTLLESIEQFDANSVLFNTHSLSYYDDVRDGNVYQPFTEAQAWTMSDAYSMADGFSKLLTDSATPEQAQIDSTEIILSTSALSANSAEGLKNCYVNTEPTLLALADINGDGLVDKLNVDNDGISYRAARLALDGSVSYGASQLIISAQEGFYNANGECKASPEMIAGQNARLSVADVNGDGIVDLIYLDKIFLGSGSEQNGFVFTESSDVDNAFANLDSVRVWKAPFTGLVNVEAPVSLVKSSNNYIGSDGVRVSVQHQDSELWATYISANDYTEKLPRNLGVVTVNKGDLLMFRVNSLADGANDQVHWDPVIHYTDRSQEDVDANALKLNMYHSSSDFVPLDSTQLVVPFSGTVSVSGLLSKPLTSDMLDVKVIQTAGNGNESVLWDKLYTSGDTLTDSLINVGEVTVTANDQLSLVISSDTNVDWSKIAGELNIHYVATNDNDISADTLYHSNGTPRFGFTLNPAMELYGYAAVSSVVSQTSHTIAIQPNLPAGISASGLVTFTAKVNQTTLVKETLDLSIDSTFNSIDLNVAAGESVYFEYHFSQDIDPKILAEWEPGVSLLELDENSSAGLHIDSDDVNKQLYRQWGHFIYDSSNYLPSDPIDVSALKSAVNKTTASAGFVPVADIDSSLPAANLDGSTQISTGDIYALNSQLANNAMSTQSSSLQLSSNDLSPQATVERLEAVAAADSFAGNNASSLSGTLSDSSGNHFGVSIGYNDQNYFCKSMTFGFQRGSSKSENDGILSMSDIDGDGLPDKVLISGGTIGYQKNLSGPGEVERFAAFQAFSGSASAFYHDKGTQQNSGFQAVIGACSFTGDLGVTSGSGTTVNDIYFSDVNGDGLIDIVANGRVLYNQRTNTSVPHFVLSSANTPNPVNESGTLVTGGWFETDPNERGEFISENPLHDTVRTWKAPYDGIVSINGAVHLVENTSEERQAYTNADGVRVAIQHAASEIWATSIDANDYGVKTPAGVNAVSVSKGDRIYFRVQSIFDGNYDQVAWAPTITYTDKIAETDANGLPIYSTSITDDYLLAGGELSLPISGKVQISGTLTKPLTSDNVTARITKIQNNGTSTTTIWEANFGVATAQQNITLTEDVDADDTYRFEILADTNVDWANFNWQPMVKYLSADDPTINEQIQDGTAVLAFKSVPSFNIFNETLRDTIRWVADADGTILISPVLTEPLGSESGTVTFTVKKTNEFLAKQKFEVINGNLNIVPTDISLDVMMGDVLFIEYHTDSPKIADMLVLDAGVAIESLGVVTAWNAGIYTVSEEFIFGPEYRGWGQFIYNGNGVRAELPIIESELKLDSTLTSAQNSPPDFNNLGQNNLADNAYDPRNSIFVMMLPIAQVDAWRGYDELSLIDKFNMSSSRFGEDEYSPSSPIPTGSVSSQPIRAINKITTFSFTGSSKGGSVSFGLSGSYSTSDQDIHILADFSDMNGDRYPDIVGETHVQYTDMLGSLLSEKELLKLDEDTNPDYPSSSWSNNEGVTLGGNFSVGSNNAANNQTATSFKEALVNANTSMPSAGISGTNGKTEDHATVSWRDINADGLPDRVYDTGEVQINLGYSFTDRENWGFGQVKEGESEASGGGLGINIGAASIKAGLSKSTFDTRNRHTLYDVNGDGLLDEAMFTGSNIQVRINKGSGFADWVNWTGANEIQVSSGETVSANASFTFCIPLPPFFVVKICTNAGVHSSGGTSQENYSLNDINGDGYPDVLKSNSESDLRVMKSTIGRTNLLKKVERPLGASFEINYHREGNTFDMPQSRWVLSNVVTNDGFTGDGADTMKQSFVYADGYYDRREREFFGFANVTTLDLDTANSDAIYRYVSTDFINDNYYEKGLARYSVMKDSGGNIFTETVNSYQTEDVFSGAILDAAGKENDFTSAFPQLVTTETFFYEGTGTAEKQTRIDYQYDNYGNVVVQTDHGDVGTSDDWTATVVYHELVSDWIVSAPKSISLRDAAGNVLRQREADINSQGRVEQVRVYADSATALTTDITYDDYGNLRTVTRPENYKGERYVLSYVMDDAVQTYFASVSDSFGYTSSSTYDYRFGAMLSNTDTNANQIQFTIDDKGRIKTVAAPYEIELGVTTIDFAYFPDADVPYATTAHFDEGKSDTIETVIFVDGLMRVIQTKKDIEIDNGQAGHGTPMMVASGRIHFDAFGRDIAQWYPVEEALGSSGTFNSQFDSVNPTRKSYDVLNRVLVTTLPDGNTLTNVYGFGSDRSGSIQFEHQSIDANGNESETYKDVRGLITTVVQHNQIGGHANIFTSYQYSAVNELVSLADDMNNVTSVIYDLAGRRTHIDSPDMGLTESVYDNASNVVQKITANLRAQGLAINYEYDFERLSGISYPINAVNNISYYYGKPGAEGNTAGRLARVSDASGTEFYQYGALGEIILTKRTVTTLTGSASKTYQTSYRYDSWNRLRELKYPDGERLVHDYDTGGSLKAMSSTKGEYTYTPLKALTYDKFGQRVYMQFGNDTAMTYSYEADRRRLDALTATNSNRTFQDNVYQYDAMSNILSVSNSASVPVDSNLFGGEAHQTFAYDNLHQLVSASGDWTSRQGHQERYSLMMSYDSIHNITAKNQLHERLPLDGSSWIVQQGTSYDWLYDYAESAQPHAASKIGHRTFSYDANGNQAGWANEENGTSRDIVWDEENRIRTISDNGHTSTYVYDAGGERVIKSTSQGETRYINAYLVVRDGKVATKHYYAGSQRIHTRVMENESSTLLTGTDSTSNAAMEDVPQEVSDAQAAVEAAQASYEQSQEAFNSAKGNEKTSAHNDLKVAQSNLEAAEAELYQALVDAGLEPDGNGNGGTDNGSINFEAKQYYYHGDHLGSSSYITDIDGEVYEHLEYFPFGETWVHEKSNIQLTPYYFTGKELDEATGLYYFGARYYDPRTSVWQSPDPVLAKYADGKVNKGLYNPQNLSLYTYTFNNPVVLKDHEGEFVMQVIGAAVTAYDAYQNYQEGGWSAVAEGVATDIAINLITGGVGKLAVKATKVASATYKGVKSQQAARKVVKYADEAAQAKNKVANSASSIVPKNVPGRGYHKEVYANKPVKPQDATDKWDEFLGPGPHSNRHPRTGEIDPNRIVSADGKRSIRYGSHEMSSKPTKHHYHEETWTHDPVNNVMNVDNTVVRVPLPKK